MPTYDYKCDKCNTDRSVQHSVHSNSAYHCEKCGGEMRKVYSIAAVTFKGGGWGKDAR